MLHGFNTTRRQNGEPEFHTRFGLHTGSVIVGNIGTASRMNYTIIGDAVNITARLHEVDKVYHTSILISEEVFHRLEGHYIARPLDLVYVKGKTKQTKIYELFGKLGGPPPLEPTAGNIRLAELFTTAYQLLSQGHPAEAYAQFQKIATEFPQDYATQMYIQRLQPGGTP
jgi:adenylate cyclase